MGRIEDAISKLQQQRPGAGRAHTGAPRPIGTVTDPNASQAPTPVSGKRIELDLDELSSQGLLGPDGFDRKLAEEYRAIKRPLLRTARRAAQDQNTALANILMVTSAVAGEGKTFTCMNLCLSIAREKDWSVLLVDGDASKRHITRSCGASAEPGLIELLQGGYASPEELIMPTNLAGLSLLPAGGADESSAELFGSSRMAEICAELSRADPQRMVILDSGPLLLAGEAPTLAAHAGQIVLVVLANGTPQHVVLEACDKLDSSKAISLLLNQASSSTWGAAYAGQYYASAEQPKALSAE